MSTKVNDAEFCKQQLELMLNVLQDHNPWIKPCHTNNSQFLFDKVVVKNYFLKKLPIVNYQASLIVQLDFRKIIEHTTKYSEKYEFSTLKMLNSTINDSAYEFLHRKLNPLMTFEQVNQSVDDGWQLPSYDESKLCNFLDADENKLTISTYITYFSRPMKFVTDWASGNFNATIYDKYLYTSDFDESNYQLYLDKFTRN